MKILTDEDRNRYNEFLEKHERCNFQQSSQWQKVKTSWKDEVVIVEDDNGDIIGSISVLIRKIPIFGNIMYSARGPVCDIHDKKVLAELTLGLKEIAKRNKAFVLKIEPDIKSDDMEFRKIVSELGFKIKDNAKNFSEEIQPRYVFRLDIKDKTEDEVFASFHQKTRYNIRLATKKGVVIKEGNREDLKAFHDIMKVTGKRDNFMIRPLSYFEKMYDELYPNHFKLMMAYYEDKPISGIIDIIYGNKVWYLYGASSNEHRNLMPNYLLQWEMIKYSIENKKDIYDFRGVSGVLDESHPQYGLYRFKKGFGAEFTEFLGEIYIPFKPLTYKLYKITERVYKKLIFFKSKLKRKK
ncbi:MAG: peptidoglycan bridge formation glycyltransferase FemA/FemB family protein [Clostridiales bacterium]|nr:peptidoglycan bridge formation glycyltransferase FemA/FemB family protein [Clostridiales bacterium]